MWIRRRLQDHRGLCGRLFGVEAIYLHRPNVLRCRWCCSREPLPGCPANPPCRCCSESQGHPGPMVRSPLSRRVFRYGMIHANMQTQGLTPTIHTRPTKQLYNSTFLRTRIQSMPSPLVPRLSTEGTLPVQNCSRASMISRKLSLLSKLGLPTAGISTRTALRML